MRPRCSPHSSPWSTTGRRCSLSSSQAVAAVRRLAPGRACRPDCCCATPAASRKAACNAEPGPAVVAARAVPRPAWRTASPKAAWTVDDPRAARLRDPRVAGVITNLVRRALELRAREAGA